MIVRCFLVPKNICINIFGTYWARDVSWIDKYVINHERIHTEQQKELLFIPFYLLYVLEWFFRLAQYRNWNDAYMNISFERETYSNGHNLKYLQNRKHYVWLKYFRS